MKLRLLFPFKPLYKVVSEISKNDGKLRHSPKIRVYFSWLNLITNDYSENANSDISIEKNISILHINPIT